MLTSEFSSQNHCLYEILSQEHKIKKEIVLLRLKIIVFKQKIKFSSLLVIPLNCKNNLKLSNKPKSMLVEQEAIEALASHKVRIFSLNLQEK